MLWVVMRVFVLLFSLVIALIDDVLNYLNLNLFNLWLLVVVDYLLLGVSGGGWC